MEATNLFGFFVIAINFVSAFAIFSQVRLTYHRKNTIGLSRTPWMMGTTNAFIGLLYALLIYDVPFIFANFAWFSMNGLMLSLIFYYGRRANNNTGV
jgi:hypothetical protein